MQVCDLRKVSSSSSDENSKRIFLYSDSPSSRGATLLEQIQLQVANVRKERNKNGNTRTAKLVFGHFTLHISQWGLIFPPMGKGVTVHFSEVQIFGGYLGRFTFFQSPFIGSCSNSGGDVAWRWLDVAWRRSQQPTLSSLCALALLPETNIMQVLLLWKCKTFLQFVQVSLKFWSTFNSNNNSYNTYNSHHLEIFELLEFFNDWDITLELNLQRLALSGLVLPATRRQEEGSKELLLPRSSCLENNETESGKVLHLLSVLALLALLPSKNPFNCAPM